MVEAIPLYLHPLPSPILPALRELKASMGLPFLLKPTAAYAGAGSRILATEPPPFVCDHALVSGMDLKDALLWVLGIVETDPRATTMARQLSAIIGGEVREVNDERDELEVMVYG